MNTVSATDIEDIEIALLLEGIYRLYGYDFRSYSPASIKRRLSLVLKKNRFDTFAQLQHRLLHDTKFFTNMLLDLTVTTSELFRDPHFFKGLCHDVLPVLQTYPALRIWHAGCSTGEEVYSLAIFLKEAGLYDRAVIYATDINPLVLKVAKMGIYAGANLSHLEENYKASGGKATLENYYTASYGAIKFDRALAENVLFAEHNLAIDEVFSETHLILCRNVFIYFNQELQNKVVELFSRSLRYKGFLCLGSKETLKFLKSRRSFEDFNATEKIYRKITDNTEPTI